MNKIIWNTYSEEDFRRAVAEATSLAEVCRKLGYSLAGGHYSTVKKRIKLLQLDTSHLKGQGWRKNLQFPEEVKPIEHYLRKDSFTPISKLRIRLIKEGIFPHQCQKCLNTEWLGEPIPLELHHCDCDVSNNTLDNLQMLCPTCHALIHIVMNKAKRIKNTIKRKAKRIEKLKERGPLPPRPNKHGIPFDDLKDELADLIWKIPTTKIAKHFGVSDKAIDSWCKKFNLTKPPRGYWAKLTSKK